MKHLHYIVAGSFYTDGDYGIRIDNIEEKFKKYISFDDDIEEYHLYFETDDPYEANRFLEELMVSFRVGSGHHWLVPDLYNLVYRVADTIFNKDITVAHEQLCGNYDGTDLWLQKTMIE